jgi:hypothetical protein
MCVIVHILGCFISLPPKLHPQSLFIRKDKKDELRASNESMTIGLHS